MAFFSRMARRIGRTQPAPPWTIVTVVTTVVAAFAALILGSTLSSLVFGFTPGALLTGWIIGSLLMAVFVTVSRSRDRAALQLDAARSPLVLVVLIAIAAALTFDLISLAVTGQALPPIEIFIAFQGIQTPGFTLWILAFVLLALAQPVGDELVFRGVVFPSLAQMMGAWGGLVATAAAHAVFHLLIYAPTGGGFTLLWYGLLLPLLEALFYTAVRAHTGSTRAAIAAHFGVGAFNVLRALTLTV